MFNAKSKPFISNAAIVGFTSTVAAVLPLLARQQPDVCGGNAAVPAIIFRGLRNTNSAFVVCLMFSFSCAFTSMVLLPKKPKASRLLNITAALWLSSAFALSFAAIIRIFTLAVNPDLRVWVNKPCRSTLL